MEVNITTRAYTVKGVTKAILAAKPNSCDNINISIICSDKHKKKAEKELTPFIGKAIMLPYKK